MAHTKTMQVSKVKYKKKLGQLWPTFNTDSVGKECFLLF